MKFTLFFPFNFLVRNIVLLLHGRRPEPRWAFLCRVFGTCSSADTHKNVTMSAAAFELDLTVTSNSSKRIHRIEINNN